MSELKIIDHRERQEVAQVITTPETLLRIAVQQGADLDKLEKLMALQERYEANEARKAYSAAMAEFKTEPLKISKNKRVHFTGQKGTTDYKHATISNVVEVVGAGLAKHGLMHTWKTEQEGKTVKVTCIITHAKGHSESTSLSCLVDDTGNKNQIQQIGSAVTYLQRYTLIAATGVATGEDEDDDGKGSEVKHITDSQSVDLMALIEETHASTPDFLKFFKIKALEELPASKFGDACGMLRTKAARRRK